MTEPTTPTGKRLAARTSARGYRLLGEADVRDILAIEREAKAMVSPPDEWLEENAREHRLRQEAEADAAALVEHANRLVSALTRHELATATPWSGQTAIDIMRAKSAIAAHDKRVKR